MVDTMHPGTLAALRALRTRQAADKLAAGPAYAESGLAIVDALGRGIHPEVYSLRWRARCKSAGLATIPRRTAHARTHAPPRRGCTG